MSRKILLAAAACGVLTLAKANAQVPVETETVAAWLARYEAAWENRDADAAAAIFTPDARYYETPFAEPFVGQSGIREYWSGVTADQRDVDFQSSVVDVVGDLGIAQWSATFSLAASGAQVELNGVFLLRFAGDGRCAELREWWHAQ